MKRLYMLQHYKSNTFVQANKKMANELLRKYFYAIEVLKRELNKSKGEVQGYDD